MNVKISVLTPTYNRAKLLQRLYESLTIQKYSNFEWIVVDDGSIDETQQVVEELKKQAAFPIKYVKQKNHGKPSAHNAGVGLAESDLTVICDDDDYLTPCALQIIADSWTRNQSSEIGGMIAYKGESESTTLRGKEFHVKVQTTHLDEIFSEGIFDTTQIYRTELLKKNLFPLTEGEKFVLEIWLWKKLDRKYTLFVLPEILEVCEYLDTGLTKNGSQNLWNNPTGYAYYFFQEYELSNGWKKVKNYGVYTGLLKFSKKIQIEKAPLWVSVLSWPITLAVIGKARLKSKKMS